MKLWGLAIGMMAVAAAAFAALRGGGEESAVAALPAAGVGPSTAAQVAAEGHQVVPALLTGVYAAFSETDEAQIYDGLAEVAAGAALEELYLERRAAMTGVGLDRSDQTVHEVRLLRIDAHPHGSQVDYDARWQVIGTVGHAEHEHVRGNAYSALLVLSPVDGRWQLTGFDLREVDRTEAGLTEGADAP